MYKFYPQRIKIALFFLSYVVSKILIVTYEPKMGFIFVVNA